MNVTVYSDGGSRGNPGSAAAGAVVMQGEKVLAEVSKYLGKQTNNVAEYEAILLALETAKRLGATEVECFLDSELVTKQMRREYRVKDPTLQILFVKVWNMTLEFRRVSFTHIPRAKNTHADRLVNQELDRNT